MIRTMMALVLVGALSAVAAADDIYVIHQNHPFSDQANTDLNNLGHNVTFSTSTLGDYTAYDQVWDLRFNDVVTAADETAFGNFLAAGGRMYVTGEWTDFFETRNQSVYSLLSTIGAGSLGAPAYLALHDEDVTPAGQIVNFPNPYAVVNFDASSGFAPANITQGFPVTEDAATGLSSLIGWDLGDITSAPNSRLLVGFDIEIFGNGQDWTENMYTYLATPEPASLALLALGGLALVRRR